ncbi:MAG: hypothetical protein R3F60_10220 [bacterium]
MIRFTLFLAAAFALAGCVTDSDGGTDDATVETDGGGGAGGQGVDGAAGQGGAGGAPDCPGGRERDACGVCGGPGPRTFYPDADGDGLGDGRLPVEACVAPARYVDNDADDEPECATNDTDDCGVCGGPGRQTWYLDADGDGLGDDLISLEACDGPVGYADVGGDPSPPAPPTTPTPAAPAAATARARCTPTPTATASATRPARSRAAKRGTATSPTPSTWSPTAPPTTPTSARSAAGPAG